MEGQTLIAAVPGSRPAVEVLSGSAPDAERGIASDFEMLERACAAAHVWIASQPAVVLGASRDAAVEVHAQQCRTRGVAVLRRASGGGTVMIGPGTVQYAFVIPHAAPTEPPPLDIIKRETNRVVCEAIAAGGCESDIRVDASGDLRMEDRKVGGLAMRRRRHATLLHGTLLTHLADLDLIALLLEHPAREPAWRRGRTHDAFLATLPLFDIAAFTRRIGDRYEFQF